MIYLPLYIAKEIYPFDIITTGNDDASILAVKEGRADMSVGDPLMFQFVDYDDLKIVGGFINKAMLFVITFNPYLESIEKKIMVTYPYPSTSFHFSKELQKQHQLELIETPFNTELGYLLTQEADIGLVLDPNYTHAVLNGAKTLEVIDREMAFTGFIAKKKDKKFFDALIKAIDIFYNDDKKTIEVAEANFPIQRSVLEKALANIRKTTAYTTSFSKKQIETGLALKGLKYGKYAKYVA